MRDFLDQLDERLQAMAVEEAEHAAPAPAPKTAAIRSRNRRRPAFLAGATASLAALGTVFAMSGTSLADLPILETPTTDATKVRAVAPGARKAGVDFTKAHAFPTPGGPGYVFLTPQEDMLCLSVPDDGRYPGACAPPATVERSGLAFEIVGDLAVDPAATSMFAFILPDGASRAQLTVAGGTPRSATIHAGVVTEQLTTSAKLTWVRAGRSESRTFDGPFQPGGTTSFTCRDGRSVSTPSEGSTVPGPTGRIKPSIVKRLCG